MMISYYNRSRPFVCPSVTFMWPANAVGHNEMPFGRRHLCVSKWHC